MASAGLNLTTLNYDPNDPDNFAKLVKLHDRISVGEMPPDGLPKPAADSLNSFVEGLAAVLTESEQARVDERGRAGLK